MTRLNRLTVVAVSALLAVTLAWWGQPQAQADQLSDAKTKLASLQEEASQAEEQYNQLQASLDAAQTKLEQTQSDIAAQQEKVDTMRDQVAIVTLQQFQDRGITSTTMLLAGGTQDDTIQRIVVSSMVTDTTTALLQNYQMGQAALDELQTEQQATVDSIAADQAKQQDLKDQANQKVQEAETLVNRLTAEQQAALATQNPTGTGASGSYTPPPPVQNGPAAQAIVNWAMARVGYGYTYGGVGPSSWDCSGFTMAAYATVGISLPHSVTAQFNYGTPVAKADLQPGDLVFFYSGPGHVGIYVGGGRIVDARNERVGVMYTSIDTGMPFAGARRLL